MSKKLATKLTDSTHQAYHWHLHNQHENIVQCTLSPRECKIPNGGLGFCGVRYNDNGVLRTLNYGKSVQMTEETIETEGVFHYWPGSKILSLGNIGCMMHCDFCQNYETSQARLVTNEAIHHYTPEQIVQTALDHKIDILSWTYNDPVVWHEFILKTAQLAKEAGLKNLYKSALYINPKPLEELFEFVDIFSISLKSLDDSFYRHYTKAQLGPVLDGIKAIYQSGLHLEISNLVVTDRNDTFEQTDKVATWVLEHLSPSVPLHYVRFQPSYHYKSVPATNVGFLEQARLRAMKLGVEHLYLGNVEDTTSAHTYCSCGAILVERYGLNVRQHITAEGRCPKCQKIAPIQQRTQQTVEVNIPNGYKHHLWKWQDGGLTIRLEVTGLMANEAFYYQFLDQHKQEMASTVRVGMERHVVSQFGTFNKALNIWIPKHCHLQVTPIKARAHYPVSHA